MVLDHALLTLLAAALLLANLYGCYVVIRTDEPAIRKILQCLFVFLLPIIGVFFVLQMHSRAMRSPNRTNSTSNETDTVTGIQGESRYD